MTQSQILQMITLHNFWSNLCNPLEMYDDSELSKINRAAIETHDGKTIEAIRKERNRRIREQ